MSDPQKNSVAGDKTPASADQAGPSKPVDGAAGGEKGKADESGKKKLPQLGALEDDDEFEDFPANAEESGTVLEALAKTDGPGDNLWEMNWDDDDIDDDFTKQLRTAINERNGVTDEAMKE